MDDYHFNLQKLNQEKTLIRGIRINTDLMGHLESTVRWVLHYCQKNNVEPPNLEQLESSIERAQNYLSQLPSHPTILDKENNRRDLDRTSKHYMKNLLKKKNL